MRRPVGDFGRGLAAGSVAVMALLICSGCGGGDDASADARAQLIQRADAICRQTDEAQKAALRAYFDRNQVDMTSGPQMEKAISRAEIPPLQAEIDQVAALPVPAGDESSVDAILAGWRRALKEAQEQPSSIFGLGQGPYEEPNQLAGRYGFKDCAEAL